MTCCLVLRLHTAHRSCCCTRTCHRLLLAGLAETLSYQLPDCLRSLLQDVPIPAVAQAGGCGGLCGDAGGAADGAPGAAKR